MLVHKLTTFIIFLIGTGADAVTMISNDIVVWYAVHSFSCAAFSQYTIKGSKL